MQTLMLLPLLDPFLVHCTSGVGLKLQSMFPTPMMDQSMLLQPHISVVLTQQQGVMVQ
jgi:hypothetical protein